MFCVSTRPQIAPFAWPCLEATSRAFSRKRTDATTCAFLDDADAGRERYFVLEREARWACGGVGMSGGECFLTYGMVRADLHRAGLGSELTRSRLDWPRQHRPAVTQVKIETSQLTEGFYARFGFEVLKRQQDGFGPGLDQVTMAARL